MRRLTLSLLILSLGISIIGCAAMQRVQPVTIQYVENDLRFEQTARKMAELLAACPNVDPVTIQAFEIAVDEWAKTVHAAAADHREGP